MVWMVSLLGDEEQGQSLKVALMIKSNLLPVQQTNHRKEISKNTSFLCSLHNNAWHHVKTMQHLNPALSDFLKN